ncbi:MAG: ABC transporter permease [Ruminococcaceae bacterium]|nr:ABC transporter permease [Oscillospiraceae bacterium]
MGRYVLKRLLMMIPVFIGVSLIVYCICGSNTRPILMKVGGEDMTLEEEAELKHELGFDQPILIRYVKYMGGMIRGDLGKSHITGDDVLESFLQTFPLTMKVAMSSVLVAILISLPLGIVSALKRGTLTDNASMVVALLGLSIPNFWFGLMMILLFALNLRWLPSVGYKQGIKSLILPAITIGTGMTARLTRQTRSSMLDVLRADYLRTARAKGVSESRVILHHALRNALIPIIATLGGQIAATLAGASVTETVFALPGVGRLVVNAINDMDVNMVTGCVTLKAMVTSVVMLLVDFLFALVDPRIKAQFAKGGKKNG